MNGKGSGQSQIGCGKTGFGNGGGGNIPAYRGNFQSAGFYRAIPRFYIGLISIVEYGYRHSDTQGGAAGTASGGLGGCSFFKNSPQTDSLRGGSWHGELIHPGGSGQYIGQTDF